MALDINLRNTLKAVVNEIKTFISGTYLSKTNNLSDVSNRQTALNTLLGADTTKTGSIPYVDTTGNVILTNRYESGAGMVANEVSIHDHRNSLVGPSGDVYVPMMYFIHRNSMDKFELEFSVFSVDNQTLPTYYGRYVFNRSNAVGMKFYCLDWVCSDKTQMDYNDILAVNSGSITHDGLQYNTTTIYRKRSNTPDFAAYCIHSMSTYSFDWSKGYVIPTYYTGNYDHVPLKDGEQILVTSDLKSLSDLTNPVAPIHQAMQSDWNQNNSTSVDYIKNRTHYVIADGFELKTNDSSAQDVIIDDTNYAYYRFEDVENLKDRLNGATMTYVDEYEYSETGILGSWYDYDEEGKLLQSDWWFFSEMVAGPLLCFEDNYEYDGNIYNKGIYIVTSDGGSPISYNISIPALIKKIDEKFIPNTIARYDQMPTNLKNGDAEGSLMSRLNSENLSPGEYSFALGIQSKATGDLSVCIGRRFCEASGLNSIAIGFDAKATGENAVSTGVGTKASGYSSHAEGEQTESSGYYSHAEGSVTVANHKSQHVSGEYNILDPSPAAANERGNYVEIVGNGTNISARSNARTLDWDGNEILMGDLTIGNALNTGTSTLTGANSLTIKNTQGPYQGSIQSLNIISKARSIINILSGGTSGTTSTINISTWSDDPTNVSSMSSGSGGGMNIYTEELRLFNQSTSSQGLFINTIGHLQSSGNSFTVENTGEGQTATNLYLIAQPGEGATGSGTTYIQGKGNPNSGAGGSVNIEATGSGSGGGGYLNVTASGSRDTATSGAGGTVNITANGAGNAGGGTISITSYAGQNGQNRSGGTINISAQPGTSESSISIAADTITLNGAVKQLKKAISITSCTPDTYYCPTAAITALVCDDTGFTGDYNYTFSGCFTAAAGMTQMPTQTDYQSITMTWYGDIGIEAGERYMFCSTKVSATEYVGVVTKLV